MMKHKLNIILSMVIIVLLLFIAYLLTSSALATQTKSCTSICVSPSSQPTITVTPSAKRNIQITGVIGLGGEEYQWQLFQNNKCIIVDMDQDKTIADCMHCQQFSGEVPSNTICLWDYSRVIKGEQTSEGQFFFVEGSEGGHSVADIYFYSFSDEKVSLLEKNRVSAGGDYNTYGKNLVKYNFYYYYYNTYTKQTPECEYPNTYNPECIVWPEIAD
jgi:hypothetical protein